MHVTFYVWVISYQICNSKIDKNFFLDLLAESTVLLAAFHFRNNDFCGLFLFFMAQ